MTARAIFTTPAIRALMNRDAMSIVMAEPYWEPLTCPRCRAGDVIFITVGR